MLFPTTIDYARPADYLTSGPQSTLNQRNAALLDGEIAVEHPDLAGAGRIYDWLEAGFDWQTGGDPGNSDINRLMHTRLLTSCQDAGIAYATLLRHFGIPAVMVETAGIRWARDFAAGRTMSYGGHVFVEAYVDRHWIVTDPSNGVYADHYDPSNPVLRFTSVHDPEGFYVLYKGTDPATYGFADYRRRMEQFADQIDRMHIVNTNYHLAPLGSHVER